MLFLLVNSCKKDSTNFSNEAIATSEELGNAKAWFNNNALALNREDFNLNNTNNWLSTLSPNWAKKVKLIDNKKQKVFEVELNNPNKIFSAGEDFDVKNIKKFRDRSLFKLLIFYDKKEDQYKSAIVELIAFEENDMPIQQIQYKQYGTFTGAINYYALNGQMVNGWIFKNGKVTSKTNKNVKLNLLLSTDGKTSNGNGKIMLADGGGGGIECGTTRIQHWTQSCITVESIVELNDDAVTRCHWKVEYTTEIIYCPSYDDDETDPGVYTGGSTPPNLPLDCAGVAGGTAYTNQDCKTCMGGTTGITECPPSLDEIKLEIENKPFALFDNIDCETLKKWLAIAKFTPPQSIINDLGHLTALASNQGFYTLKLANIQKLDDAYSTIVNMDYFSVNVTQLPKVNGQQLNASQFLSYIRTNINSFTGGIKQFNPYNANGLDDRAKWASTNPLGSIIAIDLPGPDNGSVITSYSAADKWTFTTIHEPMYGDHPVSGNRNFGYIANSNGSYTFYTQGVDRLTSWDGTSAQTIPEFFKNGSGIPFSQADALWTTFQNTITNFVETHQGNAIVNQNEILRPNWQNVKDVLEGKKPISILSKNCPD